MSAQRDRSERGDRVQMNLDRLESGRSALELDHRLVREDQVLHGHRVEGFETRVLGTLDVENLDQKILIHGEFMARRTMVCHRSGEAFELDYPVEAEIVVYRTPHRGGDAEFDEDDNWVVHQPGGVVDLTEGVLEAVVLDEPQHVVHPDHEDEVHVVAGDEDEEESGDDVIDPRWEALRKLREDDGSGDGSDHD